MLKRIAIPSALSSLVFLAACSRPGLIPERSPEVDILEESYPAEEAAVPAPISLETFHGWKGKLLWESDSGVWSILAADVLESRAGLEIVAMDDLGRANLIFMNNDEPVSWITVMDGQWLGAAGFGDVDPKRPGPELYVTGARGNVYQVVTLPQGGFESRVVWFARDEVHSLILDEAVPGNPGPDLLACTLEGGIHLLVPAAEGEPWESRLLYKDPGRVRDAVVVDCDPTLEGKEILYVSRSGRFVQLGWKDDTIRDRIVFQDAQGLARIALGKEPVSDETLVYTAGDDGRIFRYTVSSAGEWQGRVIYEGPPGCRGVAVGRFTKDPSQESLAVFGYSMEVVLLVRNEGSENFESLIIFKDTDKGHWLAAVNLDPRNDTDELVASGYSSRVVLLTLE
jgi:hypothetical protein